MEISRQLGLEQEIAALERDFISGRIDSIQYGVRVHALWADLTDAQVGLAFDGAPWLSGIQDTWAEIRANGDYCAVVSLSPSFFVERLLGWGTHAAHGSRFPSVPFSEPMDPTGILNAAAKVKIANRLCEEFGVAKDDCVAYGDSLSDLDLFAAVPVSVAVNADPRLVDLATHSYVGRDLRQAYELVRTSAMEAIGECGFQNSE